MCRKCGCWYVDDDGFDYKTYSPGHYTDEDIANLTNDTVSNVRGAHHNAKNDAVGTGAEVRPSKPYVTRK